MTDKEREDYLLLVHNAVEYYQGQLKKAKLRLEKQYLIYNSAELSYLFAVDEYENHIRRIREQCKEKGLSDAEIDALTKWRED